MLRGLWKLTWIEMKVFMREPLGAFGTIGIPVLIFVVAGACSKAQIRCALSCCQRSFGRQSSCSVCAPNLSQCGAFVDYYHFHLPRGRHSQAASRDAAASADHSQCPRDREAPAHCGNIGIDVPCGQTLLPAGSSCPMVLVYDRTADQHLEYSVDRLCHRQHRSHGPLCAADRRRHSLPDARFFRSVRPCRICRRCCALLRKCCH